MPVPSFHIQLNGKDMNPDYGVLSLDVFAEANRIPWAELCLLDGDAAQRKFVISESGDFDLGTKIKISLYYQDEPSSNAQVFEGIVTRQGVEVNSQGQLMRVECRHPAFFMTQERKSAVFPDKDDAQVIEKLMAGYSARRLSADVSKLSGSPHPELVQFFATDWDFMLSRCQANGWLVLPDGGNLKVIPNPKAESPVPQDNVMDFNVNEIYDIELTLDGAEQYESASSAAWDFQDQKPTATTLEKGTKHNPGKVDPGAITGLSAGASQKLFNGTAMPPAELKAWSAGTISRSRLSFLRGRFEMKGTAKIKPGQSCRIVGVGSRFDGIAFITGVRQRLNNAGWVTDVQLGLPSTPFFHGKAIVDAPAGGLVPGVNGIQVGVVQKFQEDKGGQYRVQVYLPAMEKDSNLLWARLCMPMAGKGQEDGQVRGLLFWPEAGDEVIVGFLNDDPRAAIILGSLYNSKNKPLYPLDAKNAVKGLVTKSGSKLEFDDEKQQVLLSTKQNLKVQLDEKEQVLTITEKAGALFKLGKEGITMEFKGNKLTLSSDGLLVEAAGNKVELGSSGVVIEGKGKVEIKGDKVELK